MVAGRVEMAAVEEAQAIERVHRHQLHVVGQVAAAGLPELLEDEGRGDDGGAGVEAEAILMDLAGAAADPFQPFQHGDAPALG